MPRRDDIKVMSQLRDLLSLLADLPVPLSIGLKIQSALELSAVASTPKKAVDIYTRFRSGTQAIASLNQIKQHTLPLELESAVNAWYNWILEVVSALAEEIQNKDIELEEFISDRISGDSI
jgi:hypothetical protein